MNGSEDDVKNDLLTTTVTLDPNYVTIALNGGEPATTGKSLSVTFDPAVSTNEATYKWTLAGNEDSENETDTLSTDPTYKIITFY